MEPDKVQRTSAIVSKMNVNELFRLNDIVLEHIKGKCLDVGSESGGRKTIEPTNTIQYHANTQNIVYGLFCTHESCRAKNNGNHLLVYVGQSDSSSNDRIRNSHFYVGGDSKKKTEQIHLYNYFWDHAKEEGQPVLIFFKFAILKVVEDNAKKTVGKWEKEIIQDFKLVGDGGLNRSFGEKSSECESDSEMVAYTPTNLSHPTIIDRPVHLKILVGIALYHLESEKPQDATYNNILNFIEDTFPKLMRDFRHRRDVLKEEMKTWILKTRTTKAFHTSDKRTSWFYRAREGNVTKKGMSAIPTILDLTCPIERIQ